MNGSCGVGLSKHNSVSQSSHHAHHHHEQPHAESASYDPTDVFAEAMASVGAEMADVPTIEAAPYETSTDGEGQADSTKAASTESRSPGLSATVMTKPCQPDCGV